MKFGLTQPFDCSYLDDHQEQLLVFAPDTTVQPEHYSRLIQAGFRRSGAQVYRPHCAACSQCESIRVKVNEFLPSKSQKRILNKNRDVKCRLVEHGSEYFAANFAEYFTLYCQYINERHQDGSMFPPDKSQFTDFIQCQWQALVLIEARLNNAVIAVAVTDVTQTGFSAFYTIFDPALAQRSLGTFMILQQIAFCQRNHLPYLYLGYQIDACRKMNYKEAFSPNERFNGEFWVDKSKK